MHEIICPHCGKAFKIDEAGYADILKQVRDKAFDKQLHERLVLAEQEKVSAVALARTEVMSVFGDIYGHPTQVNYYLNIIITSYPTDLQT